MYEKCKKKKTHTTEIICLVQEDIINFLHCAAHSLLPAYLVQFQWVLRNGTMVSHSAMTTKIRKLAKAKLFSYICIFCLCTKMAHTSLLLHLFKVSLAIERYTATVVKWGSLLFYICREAQTGQRGKAWKKKILYSIISK